MHFWRETLLGFEPCTLHSGSGILTPVRIKESVWTNCSLSGFRDIIRRDLPNQMRPFQTFSEYKKILCTHSERASIRQKQLIKTL